VQKIIRIQHILHGICTVTLLLLCASANADDNEQSRQTEATSIELSGPSGRVAEGYFTLTVSVAKQTRLPIRFPIRIEQASDVDFTNVTATYSLLGVSLTITLSGFADGEYWFRARGDTTQDAAISKPISINVRHYPLMQAVSLFTVGLVMLLLLITYIVWANAQLKKGAAHG